MFGNWCCVSYRTKFILNRYKMNATNGEHGHNRSRVFKADKHDQFHYNASSSWSSLGGINK